MHTNGLVPDACQPSTLGGNAWLGLGGGGFIGPRISPRSVVVAICELLSHSELLDQGYF